VRAYDTDERPSAEELAVLRRAWSVGASSSMGSSNRWPRSRPWDSCR